ncbi:MAG: outer membrane protein assembly factor BamB family protein, partial [Planctomycetota bacterium]
MPTRRMTVAGALFARMSGSTGRFVPYLAVAIVAGGLVGCEAKKRPDGEVPQGKPEADASRADAGPADAKTAAAEAQPKPGPARGIAPVMAAGPDAKALARQILAATGIRGGLVVHVGCGDGKLTAALRSSDNYVVHGLAAAADVARARKHVRSQGLYGRVSVARYEVGAGGRLPYADNLANLVVAENARGLPAAELVRVLVPGGVAYVRKGGTWSKTVKPRPDDIDEWSHFLHDASNNAVAKDRRVGPPRRLQWTAGPPWCRSHEFISSFCAMVTADGRVFYVMDEGQPGVTDRRLPERWTLSARGAFNGVPLWKRPLPKWRADEWRGTSMRGRPPSVPRRIVAGRDRLYATLSHRAALSVIDPATGKTLRELDGTEGTQEIALAGSTLVLRLAKVDDKPAAIAAVDADTGGIRWRNRVDRYRSQSLAAAGSTCVYHDQSTTVCLDLADGRDLWRGAAAKSVPKPTPKEQRRGKRKPRRRRSGDLTLIIHGGLVIEGTGSSITARDAKTGKELWTARTGGGAMRGMDLFVTGGRVWHAGKGGIAGYDLKTGKQTRTVDPTSVHSRGHHLRCYRAKATERYFITQFRGTEFVSLAGDDHSQNDWTRGPCRYGIMPANGMLYAPPHQCFCYPGAMMNGLNAYTTASDDRLRA